MLEQGPDFWCWFDTTQFSYIPLCSPNTCKYVFNPNVTTFQSNCAEGLHFSAFIIISNNNYYFFTKDNSKLLCSPSNSFGVARAAPCKMNSNTPVGDSTWQVAHSSTVHQRINFLTKLSTFFKTTVTRKQFNIFLDDQCIKLSACSK